MARDWPEPKDPDEVLDYEVDWSGRLNDGDTIASSEWIVPDDITKDSDDFADTATTIWLSGGSIGSTYSFVNRVTTAGGRTMDQTLRLKVKAK